MHSYFIRLNTVFFYSLTLLFLSGLLCSFQSHLEHNTLTTVHTLSSHNDATLHNSITGLPSADFSRVSLLSFRVSDRPFVTAERVWLSFSFSADLRPLWNWNVKQLFVYIRADYAPNTTNQHEKDNEADTSSSSKKKNKSSVWPRVNNRATLWDEIVTSRESSDLQYKNLRADYPLTDIHRLLRGAHLSLSLYVDIMPVVGIIKTVKIPITNQQSNNYTMILPSKYQ